MTVAIAEELNLAFNHSKKECPTIESRLPSRKVS
jgi:hypothetical protein